MTGASNFLGGSHELQFHIPRCGARRKNINRVRIELASDDTYRVAFYYVYRTGMRVKVVSEHEGIYEENLQELVSHQTGLRLSL